MSRVRNPVHRIRCTAFSYTAKLTPVFKTNIDDRYILVDITDQYQNVTHIHIKGCDQWGTIMIGGLERDYHFLFDEYLTVELFGLQICEPNPQYMEVDDSDSTVADIVDSPAGIGTEEWWEFWLDDGKSECESPNLE